MENKSSRSSFSLWMQAMRPFSFTASITPVLLGTALAWFESGVFSGVYFAAAIAGGILLHVGTNLVSEYFDFKLGSDREDTYGSSRVLVEGLMTPPRILRGGFVAFGLAFLIGVFLLSRFGMPIVWLGLAGLVGGYFYTASPLGYKYRALGEPLVFLLMGPLMVLGGYFVQTGAMSWTPVYVSLPIGILVAAILNANNLRDIPHDTRAGFSTVSSKMGWSISVKAYRLLILSAYAIQIVIVALGAAPLWTLLVLITLLPSLKLHKIASAAKPMTPSDLPMLDIFTAQLHFQFGLLLTIGFVLGRLV